MAHHAEPMDIDDEGDFDNKENKFQHSNVLPKTPSTEKGYEELDVSELNMKLRYSITPAASPMSKSMSQCLDNQQNNLTDESLNNTVINEYENNLTRSLNSTLNKTEIKSSKILPLQVLPTDVDSNRSSVLRPLDSATGNDITITVSNENEIDNLSFPSSSSSMAQTPEATTPTKEMPKHDAGSPIMRGLKSVLSMFRSSQSPIPPEEEDPNALNSAVSPADVLLPESKLRAIASTPKSENNKEKSLSRRNSPHKESIVFNEDLEKELQWNDDSTIVFSTEKIPIHKLFFQDKPSKSATLNESIKQEDANSTVEYMDVSYNDLSIRDRTLHGTVNKSKVNEAAESDGEFLDCETTFTESDAAKINESQIKNAPIEMADNATTIKESFTLDTTKDIINSIDATHAVEADLGKTLDFSATDIVNQLSDLINESETSPKNVISVENKDTVVLVKHDCYTAAVSDVQSSNKIQPDLLENQITSPVNIVTDSSPANEVSNDNLIHAAGIVSHTIVPPLVSVEPKIILNPVDIDAIKTHDVAPQMKFSNETITTKALEGTSDNEVGHPSPVDIPLSNDDFNDIVDEILYNDVQDKDTLKASTSQNALMSALNKSLAEAPPELQHKQVESQHKVISCPPKLLPSDVPLPNKDKENSINTNIPHEATTVVLDPVLPDIKEPDTSVDIITSIDDVINDADNSPIAENIVDIPNAEPEAKSMEPVVLCSSSVSSHNIPLTGMNNDNPKEKQCVAKAVYVVAESVQPYATEKPNKSSTEDNRSNTTNVHTGIESSIVKSEDIIDHIENNVAHVAIVNSNSTDLVKPVEEHMENTSFIESNNTETVPMDVSMADANVHVEDTIAQPEVSQKDPGLFNVMSELPEIVNENRTDLAEIVNADHLGQTEEHIHISENLKIESENIIDESISQKIPETTADKGLLMNATPIKESPHLSALSEMVVSETNAEKIVDSQLNDVPDIVRELNTTSTAIATVLTGSNDKEIKNTALQHNPKGSDSTINYDSVHKVEIPGCEEKMDEEIILSESNSPFVSMSAEDEFDPESKKDDFERIDNPLSTKSKVAQSPPISPKIVSKGYNFNFDDIDNINPFDTKTKIRISPLPGASPSALTTDKLNKTEILEPVKSEKDVNRRKSMPEKKRPLKAKRHLNSSIDSTEKSSPKKTLSKTNNLEIAEKMHLESEQLHISRSELEQHDHGSDAHLKEEVNNVNIEIAIPTEAIAHEQKSRTESACMPVVGNSGDDAIVTKETAPSVHHLTDESVKTEDEINLTQNTEANVIEAMSGSGKSQVKPDTSSSEQSTYFSVGTSSTELTDSKNVFNLPELDDFNPFATKSKIRQSPPKEFDMDNPFATKNQIKSSPETSLVVDDCNSTLTIGNEEELKEANSSGSSKTSDDKDVTVHEVHTEDEDTLEGPFLEADDGIDIPESPDDKVAEVDFDNIRQDDDDAAEMFIDAEAFEFLMNQNKTEEVAYSGKESLFLKFDPLFARRVTSEGVAAALNDIKRKQNTPKKVPKQAPSKEVELLSFEKPVAGPSDLNCTYDAQNVVEEKSGDMYVAASKPMMAVTPAVNPIVTPRKSLTPNRANRLSMTFTSPAMAVIDRLLSLSGNSPAGGLDTTVTHVDRSHNETDQALTQLRELLAEKEIHVYNLRCETKELKGRLSSLETQMKALEAESTERLKKVNELNENLAEKTKMNRNMAAVVEEYERTIASLISETAQDKKRYAEERNQLIKDRDEQTAHLASMEVSFNDLHSKYEKSKQVIMGYKTNEEAYKKSIQEFEENLAKMHTNYELLKQHATSKLNHANQELEKIYKAHEGEILKFNAMLKRKEVHITSLEESLAQKTKANEELTAICDELINKVG